MILNIISTIIGIIIYNIGKKIVEIYIIKKNKKNLQTIINTMVEKQNINKLFDKDFWGDK